MSDFIQLVKERRSASNFLANYSISREELNEIFELVKLGPSAFNLQHTNYLAVIDPVIKEEIKKAAKEKGWDTCPMIGFDPDAVKNLLNISDRYEVAMMITIGKEKVESRKPRGYRKPVAEFVTYV